MDIRFALKRQYGAALAMLRECIELATPEIWTSGVHPRNFWRIAYHGLFYTHLYLSPSEADFVAWEKHRDSAADLWMDENPPVIEPYTKEEVLGYADWLTGRVEEMVAALDLESPVTGIPWYKEMGKLEHQILNVRHLQGHVGQLSEILMAAGIDGDYWISKG